MPTSSNLSDLQLVLLSSASNRKDGNLFPLPKSIDASRPRIEKEVSELLKLLLAEEEQVSRLDRVWREEEGRRLGATIVEAGRVALGIAEGPEAPDTGSAPPLQPTATPAREAGGAAAPARTGTKRALLIEMIEREAGATIEEITGATDWLPHTTRAALTGLRKSGWEISLHKEDGGSRYRGKKVTG